MSGMSSVYSVGPHSSGLDGQVIDPPVLICVGPLETWCGAHVRSVSTSAVTWNSRR
jgi:hypothetical protein